MTEDEREPCGRPIGGWLVVLGLSITGSFIKDISFLKENLPTLFNRQTMEGLGPWGSLLGFNVFFNCFLSVMNPILLTLFLLRRRAFPWTMINTLGLICFGLLIKSIWLRFLPNSAPIFSLSYARNLAQVLLSCAWIVYLVRSERVKQTFVR